MENENQNKEQKIKYIIGMGAEIAGGAVGTALGLITANPFLVVTLGAAGAGIAKGLVDTTEKYLSNREKTRIGAAAAQSIAKIDERVKKGQSLRNDHFFYDTSDSRSNSEELFEGVLLSSKNEHEEKKVTFIANIFSNSAFLTISLGEANHVLRIANNLTYRQLCVLGLVVKDKSLLGISLGGKWLRVNEDLIPHVPVESISIRQEIMDMYSQGLISCQVAKENDETWSSAITQGDDNIAMLGWYDVVPAGLKLTELGDLCYNLMSLNEISNKDILEVAKLLEI